MEQQWYYGQAADKQGPFSALELKALASAGKIVLTDTIWKEGVELGALASRVKHLFVVPEQVAPIVIQVLAEITAAEPPAALAEKIIDPPTPVVPVEAPEAAAPRLVPTKQPERKCRAVAMRGAKLMGQDGLTVQFKKICTTCGHEDATRSTIKIRTGVTRIQYYCPKCRKPRAVEIQGIN